MATALERQLQISPIVQESVQHNTRVQTTLRSLTSSLFGIASGILGLESSAGFAFYVLGTLFVSLLVFLLRADGLASQTSSGASSGAASGTSSTSGASTGHDREGEGKGKGGQRLYFESPYWELWAGGGDLFGGLSSFVLTWTLFYGLVRA